MSAHLHRSCDVRDLGSRYTQGYRNTGWLKSLAKHGVCVVLSLACASPSFACGVIPAAAYADDSAQQACESQQQEEAAVQQEAQNLNEIWTCNQDVVSITQGGVYRLQSDLDVKAPLVVSAPADSKVTIDLAGFDVTVNAQVSEAAIVIDGEGDVVVCDSKTNCEPGLIEKLFGSGSSSKDAKASVTLLAQKASSSVSCIKVKKQQGAAGGKVQICDVELRCAVCSLADDAGSNAASKVCAYGICAQEVPVSQNAKNKDASKAGEGSAAQSGVTARRVMVDGCSFKVALPSSELAGKDSSDDFKWITACDSNQVAAALCGPACALVSDGIGFKLADSFDSTLASDAGSCDLFSFGQGSLLFAKGFDCADKQLSIYQMGAQDGSVLARASSKSQAQKLAKVLCDPTGEASCIAIGRKLVYQTLDTDSSGQEATAGMQLMSKKSGSSKTASATAVKGKSLNKIWKDKGSKLDITKGGTYYLSDDLDLEESGALEVNAPGKEVTIDLRGHTIKSVLDYIPGVNLCVAAAKKVTIKNGTVVCSNSVTFTGLVLRGEATKVVLSKLNLRCVMDARFPSFTTASVRALEVRSGSLNATGCEISVDLTGMYDMSGIKADDVPMAVYVTGGTATKRVRIANSKINATSTSMVTTGSGDSYWGGGLNTYGLRSQTTSPVVLAGCDVSCAAPHASVFGVSGSNITLQGTTSFNLSAQAKAFGACSTAAGGVKLAGKLKLEIADIAKPAVSAALYSSISGGFKIMKGFGGSDIGVVIGDQNAENLEGTLIAKFDSSATKAQRAGAFACFANPLASQVPTKAGLSGGKVAFVTDEDQARATLVSASGSEKRYSTATAAARYAKDGDTITLTADDGRVAFDTATATKNVTFDLAGHTITSLVHADATDLKVVDSTGQGGIVAHNGASSAVAQSGTGQLSLNGVSVSCRSIATASYAVQVSGDGGLELDGCSLEASSQTADSVGLDVAGSASGEISLSGCSFDIWTSAASTACYGVLDQANQGSLSVTGGKVCVQTVKGAATGVSCKQPATLKGDAAGSLDIAVSTMKCAKSATGIIGTSSSASFNIERCSVDVRAQDGVDTSSADYWCMVSGAVNVQAAVGWTFGPDCSFVSSNDTVLLQGAKSVTLAQGFSLVDGQQISVGGTQVPSNVLAICADGAQQAVALFKAAPDGYYDSSWTLGVSAADVNAIAWQHSAVAQIGETSYPSVQEALAAAKDGDTVKLTADVSTKEPVAVNKSITFDLGGHVLTVDTVAKGSGAALTCQGGKNDITITNGTLKALLGGKDDSSLKDTAGYKAVASSALTLTLSNINIESAYAGSYATQTDFSLYGVYQSGGSVTIGAGTNVSVRSNAGTGNDSHAMYLYGAYVASGTSMLVDSSANISVESSAQSYLGGDVYTTGAGSAAVKEMALERVDPPHDSDLYKEIYARFKKFATLDADSTYGFGSRVYYVESIPLSDGTYAWAYSKPVPVGQEGGDYCKPDLIFTQAKHTVLPSAYGVASLDTNTAQVTVKGQVSTSSPQGDAIALRAYDKATWNVTGATLKANSGASTVARQIKDKALDLRDFFDDITYTGDKTVFFPNSGSYYQLKYCKQRAWGVHAAASANITLDGTVSISTSGGDEADIVAPQLETGENFTPAAGQALSLGSEQGANEQGEVAVSGTGKLKASWFADAYGENNLKATDDGELEWTDLFTAGFYNGELEVASYEQLQSGTNVNLPDPESMKKGTHLDQSYTFLGWSTDPHATQAEVAANAGAVTVTGNVKYYAVYAIMPLDIKCTFENLRGTDGDLLDDVQISCRAKQAIEQGSDQDVPAQGDYSFKGDSYRFVGWKTSGLGGSYIADGQDLGKCLVLDYNVTGVTSGNVVFTAVYARVSQGEHLVTFKSDYAVDYGVFKDGQVPAYDKSVGAKNVYPSKRAGKTGCDYILRGWHRGYLACDDQDGAVVDYEDGVALPTVSEDVCYTALFEEIVSKTYLEFYYWQLVDGVYKYTASDEITFDYGEDINERVSELVKLGDTFTQDGVDYVFAGWSPRAQDKVPVYTDDLPLSTGTVNTRERSMAFYGIYTKGDQKVQVVFHDGQDVYATVDATASDSVKEALALSGKGTPADKSDTLKFLGWSSQPAANQVDIAGSTSLGNAAAGKSSLDLYAVYGSTETLTVTFVDSDQSTVLETVQVKGSSTIAQSGVSVPRPSKNGSYFKGWVTSTGESFNLATDAVIADIQLFAQYGKLTTEVQEGLKAKLSVDQASFTADAGIGKSMVKFSLYRADNISTDLLKKVKAKGGSVIGDAIYRGLIKAGSVQVESASDLGKVAVSVPVGTVSSKAKVRAYWMDANGDLKSSAVVKAGSGKVSFNLSSYTSDGNDGNIVVAQVPSTRAANLDGSKVHNGSIGSDSANLPINSSGAKLNGAGADTDKAALAKAKGARGDNAAAASSNQTAAASGNGITQDDLRVISDIPDEEQVAQAYLSIAGNPVIWLLALLIAVLIAFALYRMLVVRKREVFEQPVAGWSDDAGMQTEAASSEAKAGDLTL